MRLFLLIAIFLTSSPTWAQEEDDTKNLTLSLPSTPKIDAFLRMHSEILGDRLEGHKDTVPKDVLIQESIEIARSENKEGMAARLAVIKVASELNYLLYVKGKSQESLQKVGLSLKQAEQLLSKEDSCSAKMTSNYYHLLNGVYAAISGKSQMLLFSVYNDLAIFGETCLAANRLFMGQWFLAHEAFNYYPYQSPDAVFELYQTALQYFGNPDDVFVMNMISEVLQLRLYDLLEKTNYDVGETSEWMVKLARMGDAGLFRIERKPLMRQQQLMKDQLFRALFDDVVGILRSDNLR